MSICEKGWGRIVCPWAQINTSSPVIRFLTSGDLNSPSPLPSQTYTKSTFPPTSCSASASNKWSNFVHYYICVCFWRNSPTLARAASCTRFIEHTQWHTTVGRTTLHEGSARHRDFYLTKHNTHNRQASMPPAGFEPAIQGKRTAVDHRPRSLGHWEQHVAIFTIIKQLTTVIKYNKMNLVITVAVPCFLSIIHYNYLFGWEAM